jgi:hypothetical protein
MLRNNLYPRIILDLAIFVSIINGWWFIAIPLCVVGLWYVENFLEIIIAGIAYDGLFGMNNEFGWYAYVGTIFGILLYTCMHIVKKFVRK